MNVAKQVVFISAVRTVKDGVLDLKVFSESGDALRHTGGDREKVIRRTVIPDSGRGRYRKPPKAKPKGAR